MLVALVTCLATCTTANIQVTCQQCVAGIAESVELVASKHQA